MEEKSSLAGWLFIGACVGVAILWWWIKMRIKAGMIGRAVERERRKGRRDEGED